MTHDELLAKIGENAHLPKWDNCSCGENTEGFEHHLSDIAVKKDKALRAVVELHKPRAYKNEVDEMYIKGWNAAMDRVIQVIEKELNG